MNRLPHPTDPEDDRLPSIDLTPKSPSTNGQTSPRKPSFAPLKIVATKEIDSPRSITSESLRDRKNTSDSSIQNQQESEKENRKRTTDDIEQLTHEDSLPQKKISYSDENDTLQLTPLKDGILKKYDSLLIRKQNEQNESNNGEKFNDTFNGNTIDLNENGREENQKNLGVKKYNIDFKDEFQDLPTLPNAPLLPSLPSVLRTSISTQIENQMEEIGNDPTENQNETETKPIKKTKKESKKKTKKVRKETKRKTRKSKKVEEGEEEAAAQSVHSEESSENSDEYVKDMSEDSGDNDIVMKVKKTEKEDGSEDDDKIELNKTNKMNKVNKSGITIEDSEDDDIPMINESDSNKNRNKNQPKVDLSSTICSIDELKNYNRMLSYLNNDPDLHVTICEQNNKIIPLERSSEEIRYNGNYKQESRKKNNVENWYKCLIKHKEELQPEKSYTKPKSFKESNQMSIQTPKIIDYFGKFSELSESFENMIEQEKQHREKMESNVCSIIAPEIDTEGYELCDSIYMTNAIIEEMMYLLSIAPTEEFQPQQYDIPQHFNHHNVQHPINPPINHINMNIMASEFYSAYSEHIIRSLPFTEYRMEMFPPINLHDIPPLDFMRNPYSHFEFN